MMWAGSSREVPLVRPGDDYAPDARARLAASTFSLRLLIGNTSPASVISPVSTPAMTGEITLAGLVLPIGGLKEKVLAARRAGIRRVVIPRPNEQDLRELPDHVRKEMEFVLADRIEDVFVAVIPGLRRGCQ